jgi:hypothetical protein
MVKAALAVGLSRKALEKMMATMGLFGNMPQDIWDASVDYIEGEAAARAAREKRVRGSGQDSARSHGRDIVYKF